MDYAMAKLPKWKHACTRGHRVLQDTLHCQCRPASGVTRFDPPILETLYVVDSILVVDMMIGRLSRGLSLLLELDVVAGTWLASIDDHS
jgi:hypothetical protein